MSLTSLHAVQPEFKVDRQKYGLCIGHYSISSPTMRCCIAVSLWNKCWCNSGRTRYLWTFTV